MRDATLSDIPDLLAMGERFAAAIGLNDTVGYDPASVERLFRTLIESDDGILIMADGGAAGGLVHPSLFNNEHRTGQELFWWVDPDKRGQGVKLMAALEDAARAKGAASWMMSTMDALDHEGAARVYERRGYRATDRNYLKVFH